MNSIINISNEKLTVGINTAGAYLTSVFSHASQREMMWQGDDKAWNGQDIMIFPFVARMKDGYYHVDGMRHSMPKHGICRKRQFDIEEHNCDKLVMSISFNAESLEQYPYKFKAYAIFELIGSSLSVCYRIQNMDNKTIYYGIGGHPAFQLDGVESEVGTDTSGNYLSFDKEYDLRVMTCDESNFYVTGERAFGKSGRMQLSKDLFANDAVIFKNNFNTMSIKRRDGGIIRFTSEADYMAIWSHSVYGAYCCIEPWWSTPDEDNPCREMSGKYSIKHAKKGEHKDYLYIIEVID